jgi:regulator of RNase E activity RraA
MSNIENEIIEFIQRNRVSTTEVADALGKAGIIPELMPISEGQHKVGRVHCVFTAYESNYEVHDQLRSIKEGEVVIVFTHECKNRAILGEIVSRYTLMYKGAEALVVDGSIRDISRLRRERYNIWANGSTPIGCFNTQTKSFPIKKRKELEEKFNKGIAVCDDGGVVVIPSNQVNTNMLENLQKIELQEDVWAYCLNTLKWDTKRIICDKEYLIRSDLLPDEYKRNLINLSESLDKSS